MEDCCCARKLSEGAVPIFRTENLKKRGNGTRVDSAAEKTDL